MKLRLRVFAALAATVVLGVGGAVAATVPALASPAATSGLICEQSDTSYCIAVAATGDQYFVATLGTGGFQQNCSGNGNYPYGSPQESYCEVHVADVDGNSDCLEWDSGNNGVYAAACNGNTLSQHWWWDGSKFRNLYATMLGDPVCLRAQAAGQAYLVLGASSDGYTAWNWG
jgi:hypothetical protein